jgi:hypothetical protein
MPMPSRIAPALACAALLGAGGCGAPAQRRALASAARATLLPAMPLSAVPPRPVVSRSAPPPVGTPQSVRARGARVTVTALAVIDSLTGSGAALPAQTRATGIEVRIANAGPAVYDSSATGDFSLLLDRGSAAPIFVPRGVCRTPLQDFDNEIGPGGVRTGCVAFAVPAGTRVRGVRFAPHAVAQGGLIWRVR